jgi:8-oxo-dGTP diphosphatase
MLHVVCAIIEHQGNVLITQRSATMAQPMLWEFPGGKIDAGESETDALVREIHEELNLTILPKQRLTPVTHTYRSSTIELIPYTCSLQSGEISLAEHMAYGWVSINELQNYTWCPADVPIMEEYIRLKQ